MLKRTLLLLSIPAAFYLNAQDISVIRNTAEVYSGNEINGSSKYTAMAGSMGALGGDMSSTNLNPAGIGVNILSDLNVSLGITGYKNTSSLAGKTQESKINKTLLNNASAIIALDLNQLNSHWKFVNIGMNHTSQKLDSRILSPGNQNISIQKNLIDANNNPVVGNLTYLGHLYDRVGDLSKTNITIAANYNNNLYFGLGVNMSDTYLEQFDVANFGLSTDNSTSIYEKQYTPFSEKANGFSANFGVIGKINNQLRLGAAIETPTWWRMDRLYTDHYTDTSGYISSETFYEDRKLSTPMKATLSAAFVPSKNFAINVDYIQGLTKPKYKEIGGAETELNDFFKSNYKNTSEVRVGAEYRYEGLRVRGGYAFANSPFDALSISSFADNGSASDKNYNNLILSNRNTLGFGIGYDFKAFYIDAAYQNISSKYTNPFLQGSEDYGTGYYSQNFDINSDTYAVSDVDNKWNNFVITLGWKF